MWHNRLMNDTEYKARTLAIHLRQLAEQYPVVAVSGPRGCGKTWLVKEMFSDTHSYCSLDDPAVRRQAQDDPLLLLNRFRPPLIIDGIQYAPQLLAHIEDDLIRHPDETGRYIITGSLILPLMDEATDRLLARTATTTLLSMSFQEMFGESVLEAPWVKGVNEAQRPTHSPVASSEKILRGGFPELVRNPDLDAQGWHGSYIQTILERDTRSLRAVMDIGDFERFVFAMATRCSQLINLQEVARELGITGKTVRAWIELLETSGQVFVLRQLPENMGKRMVKRPKVYFLDTGTLAFLMNINDKDQALSGIAAEPLFETAVLGQILRHFVHRVRPGGIHFWQTAAGHKVDFIIEEEEGRYIPIDAKLTSTPTAKDGAAIMAFQRLVGRKAQKGLVVCLCRKRIPLTSTVDAIPLSYL
jgi:uncharacterized protein